jgi:hypothetical protein
VDQSQRAQLWPQERFPLPNVTGELRLGERLSGWGLEWGASPKSPLEGLEAGGRVAK